MKRRGLEVLLCLDHGQFFWQLIANNDEYNGQYYQIGWIKYVRLYLLFCNGVWPIWVLLIAHLFLPKFLPSIHSNNDEYNGQTGGRWAKIKLVTLHLYFIDPIWYYWPLYSSLLAESMWRNTRRPISPTNITIIWWLLLLGPSFVALLLLLVPLERFLIVVAVAAAAWPALVFYYSY